MKSTLLLLAFVLAACGDDSGSDAGIDGNDLRPDGNNDLDLDGIKDDVDNCPAATNAFQGNEDGDKFGDACDPCPMIADDNPPDGDNDGVADACDPLPIMFGDRIAFFEGFHQGVPQGWDFTGTWTTQADQLRGMSAGEGHAALIVTDRTRETVMAKITVVSTTGAASEVGLLDNKIANGLSAVACTLTGAPAISVYETTNTAGAVTSAYQLTAGQTYTIKLRRDNSTYTCSAVNGAATAMATKAITLGNAPYLSGLRINGASIRIDWFMVVESL